MDRLANGMNQPVTAAFGVVSTLSEPSDGRLEYARYSQHKKQVAQAMNTPICR